MPVFVNSAVPEPRPVAADQRIGILPLQTHELEAVGLKLTATSAAVAEGLALRDQPADPLLELRNATEEDL